MTRGGGRALDKLAALPLSPERSSTIMTDWTWQMWSWALTGVGATGQVMTGRGSAWGWAVGVGAQGLWTVYAVSTGQWGFVASAVVYGTIGATNFRRWRARDVARRREDAELAA